ncbi:MAG: hypothetical protein M3Y40_01545 [Chloroflexota bacterium]|nr:hypothetical protein [Chloroflexota bacterium]
MTDTEADMNSYTMHQVGMARQHERLASAHRAYDAKQARANARPSRAAHTADVHRQSPLSWLRETIGGAAAHFTARTTQPSHH